MPFAALAYVPFGHSFGGGFGRWKEDSDGPAGIIEGLQLWFKADDTSKVDTSGGKIMSWQSSGGQSAVLTSSGGQELSYINEGINGRPVARGFGSQSMSTTISAFAPKQFFVVAKHNTIGNFQWVFSFGSVQNDTSFLSSSIDTEAFKLETNNGAQQLFQSTIDLNQSEFNILGGEINSASSQLQFNTETVVTGTLANVDSSKFNLLQSFDGGGRGEYDIAEVIIYDRVVTASEQKVVEEYLLNKYFSMAIYNNNNNVLLDNNYNILIS
jgi:hypothetical protein